MTETGSHFEKYTYDMFHIYTDFHQMISLDDTFLQQECDVFQKELKRLKGLTPRWLIQAPMAYSTNITMFLFDLLNEILNLSHHSFFFFFFDIFFAFQDFPDTYFNYILIVTPPDILDSPFYYILAVMQDFFGTSFLILYLFFWIFLVPCFLMFFLSTFFIY